MAYEEILQPVTLETDEDLTSKQYFLGALSTDGQFKVTAARGGVAYLVAQEKSTAAGISVKCAAYGITKVAAGDTSGGSAIAFGDALMASSVGRAVPTTLNIGDYVVGRAFGTLAASNTGIISMLLTHQGMSSS